VKPDFQRYPESGFSPPAPGTRGIQVLAVARSGADGRLVVVGSSSFASDELHELSLQLGERDHSNLDLVANMVRWAAEDPALAPVYQCAGSRPPD
jgi:hypothetical protein